MNSEPQENLEFTEEEIRKYRILVNTCDFYHHEYKDCGSISARLHQRFVHGDEIDCGRKKQDYDNCLKWQDNGDERALDELTKSEMQRRHERMRRTNATSQVWEFREEPPSDAEWRPPLPEFLQQKVDKSSIGLQGRAAPCVLM